MPPQKIKRKKNKEGSRVGECRPTHRHPDGFTGQVTSYSSRSVSCAIPPTGLIEQGKIATKAGCDGNGHARNEVAATAKIYFPSKTL